MRRPARRFVFGSILFPALATACGYPTGSNAPRVADGPETRVEIDVPATTDAVSMALSPDGSQLAYVVDSGGGYQLWVLNLASEDSHPLPGTQDAVFPFPCWSPDSRSIAYFGGGGGGQLRRFDLDSGEIRNLVVTPSPGRGCAWGRGGQILYTVSSTNPVWSVFDTGGGPQAAVAPPASASATSPFLLPDERNALFYVVGDGVYVGEVVPSTAIPLLRRGFGSPTKLLEADAAALYSVAGYLLFVRSGTLYAQRFDAEALELIGEPFAVARDIPVNAYRPAVAVSGNGDLAYRTGGGGNLRQFKWLDRAGNELEAVGDPVPLEAAPPMLSPDGGRIVFDRALEGNSDIWILEVANGAATRLTTDPGNDSYPVWADGNTIYLGSNRAGQWDMYRRSAERGGGESPVMSSRAFRLPRDISRDGRFVLYRTGGETFRGVDLTGDPPRELDVQQGPGMSDYPRLSPDSRWVAYQANGSGRFEVYLQEFPSGGRIQATTGGGAFAQWRSDGRELYYVAPDGRLMAVPVMASADGGLELGTAVPLFDLPTIGNAQARRTGSSTYRPRTGRAFWLRRWVRTHRPWL